MGEILNTGLTFWQIIGIAITLILGFIAVKISLSFDINKHLESKKEQNRVKIMNACTHMEILLTEDKKMGVRSCFVSPPGTLQYQCQKCGLITYRDDEGWERTAKYYLNNPEEYKKQNDKFNKLLKKSGLL